MLSLLSLFNFFILNLYQIAVTICITHTYQKNSIYYSLLSKIFPVYVKLSIFLFFFLFVIIFT